MNIKKILILFSFLQLLFPPPAANAYSGCMQDLMVGAELKNFSCTNDCSDLKVISYDREQLRRSFNSNTKITTHVDTCKNTNCNLVRIEYSSICAGISGDKTAVGLLTKTYSNKKNIPSIKWDDVFQDDDLKIEKILWEGKTNNFFEPDEYNQRQGLYYVTGTYKDAHLNFDIQFTPIYNQIPQVIGYFTREAVNSGLRGDLNFIGHEIMTQTYIGLDTGYSFNKVKSQGYVSPTWSSLTRKMECPNLPQNDIRAGR